MKEGNSLRSKGKGFFWGAKSPLRKISAPACPSFRPPPVPEEEGRYSVGDPFPSTSSSSCIPSPLPPHLQHHSRSDEGLMRQGAGKESLAPSRSATTLPPLSVPHDHPSASTAPSSAKETGSEQAYSGRPRSNSDGDSSPLHHGGPSTASVRTVDSTSSSKDAAKKKRSFAFSKKFSFLGRRGTEQSLGRPGDEAKLTKEEISRWSLSFDALLKNKHGLSLFHQFLEREFSDENIEFWIACEEYKRLDKPHLLPKAQEIYDEFVAVQSPKEVNLDSWTRSEARSIVESGAPALDIFDNAQHRIQNLMEKDSFPRFIKSDLYLALTKK